MRAMDSRNSKSSRFYLIHRAQTTLRIAEMQGDAIVRRYPSMRIASLRPHFCIAGEHPDPIPLLPLHPQTFQKVTFERISSFPSEKPYKQLWGWNTYEAIAQAFFLSITNENRGWESGHETFFIVHPRIGTTDSTPELATRWFPKAEIRAELKPTDGLYDCSKAERLFGWVHE